MCIVKVAKPKLHPPPKRKKKIRFLEMYESS